MTTRRGAARAVEALDQQLAGRTRSWVKLRTVASLAGQKNLSAKLLRELQDELPQKGIYHLPSDLEQCTADETLLISRSPYRDRGLSFATGRELDAFIAEHYKALPPFARCTAVELQKGFGDMKVDLWFRERGGAQVVCETEKDSGRFEPASQIREYLEAVQESAMRCGREARVRGVVITGEPNPSQEAEIAEWSSRTGTRVDWYYYRLALHLEPATLQYP